MFLVASYPIVCILSVLGSRLTLAFCCILLHVVAISEFRCILSPLVAFCFKSSYFVTSSCILLRFAVPSRNTLCCLLLPFASSLGDFNFYEYCILLCFAVVLGSLLHFFTFLFSAFCFIFFIFLFCFVLFCASFFSFFSRCYCVPGGVCMYQA